MPRRFSLGRPVSSTALLAGLLWITLSITSAGASPPAGVIPDEESGARRELEVARDLFASARYPEALEHGERALVLAEQEGDERLLADVLELCGDAHFYLDHWALSAASFSRALVLEERLGDPERIVVAQKNLAVALRTGGQLEDALRLLEAAARRFERVDSELAVSVLGNLGAVYERMGSPQLAIGVYERLLRDSIAGDGEARSAVGAVDIHTRLGSLYLENGLSELAVVQLERAHRLAAETATLPERAWAEALLGAALVESGHPRRALERLESSARFYGETGIADAHAHRLLDLSIAYRDLGEIGRAEELVTRALATSDRPMLQFMAAAQAARLALLQERPQEALGHARIGLAAVDRSRASFSNPFDQDSFSGSYRPLIDLLVLALSQTDDELPAESIVLSLERLLPQDAIDGPVEESAVARRAIAETDLAILQQRLAAPDLETQERTLLLTMIERLELEIGLTGRSLEQRVLRPDTTIDLAALQRSLAEGEALLRLHCARGPASGALLSVVIRRSSISARRTDLDCDDLERTAGHFVEHIEQDRAAGWTALSERLHGDLIAPQRDALRSTRRLHLVLSGPLAAIPFEALSTRENGPRGGRRRFLIEDVEIAYELSLGALLGGRGSNVMGERAAPGEGAMLVMATGGSQSALVPDSPMRAIFEGHGFTLDSIDSVEREAQALRRYENSASRVLTGSQATERWLEDHDLGSFTVLHFAAHGLGATRRAERSALVLVPTLDPLEDGFLQAREIARLELAPDLVVLSACRTSAGARGSDRAFKGLAHAFRIAGASNILGSLWRVDDDDTARFMARFYARLAEGEPPGAALRSTKLEWLERSARSGGESEPRRWASFVLLGSGEEPVRLGRAPLRHRVARLAAGAVASPGPLLLLAAALSAGLGWSLRRAGS